MVGYIHSLAMAIIYVRLIPTLVGAMIGRINCSRRGVMVKVADMIGVMIETISLLGLVQ